MDSWYYQVLYCGITYSFFKYNHSISKTCFKSGPHGRQPIGEWATLFKCQK